MSSWRQTLGITISICWHQGYQVLSHWASLTVCLTLHFPLSTLLWTVWTMAFIFHFTALIFLSEELLCQAVHWLPETVESWLCIATIALAMWVTGSYVTKHSRLASPSKASLQYAYQSMLDLLPSKITWRGGMCYGPTFSPVSQHVAIPRDGWQSDCPPEAQIISTLWDLFIPFYYGLEWKVV